MKKIINTKNAPAPIGSYSQAVLANGMLFVSGQIPIDPNTGNIVLGDIKVEARQVMENIRAILIEAKLDFSHVVKSSIFLSNMSDFPLVNEVYSSYFNSNFPARETIEVSKLPKSVNIEISVIAIENSIR